MEKVILQKQKRYSNIELLRIIAMFMIIMHHYAIHGFSQMELEYNKDKIVIDFFVLGGKVGVNLFIIISGYFMVDSKITLQKILKFMGQVWCYSVTIFVLFFSLSLPKQD